jgi:hypothetical protein
LVDDKDSNLGWRLCAETLVDDEDVFRQAVKKTSKCDVPFAGAVPQPTRALTKKLRAACVKLNDGNGLTSEQSDLLFSWLGVAPQDLAETSARDKIFRTFKKNPCSDTKIKLTTILGSKGLSYDYVFLVNFDDKYLIPAPQNITDERINGFLVALTRSRKKITIFSSQGQGPTFVTWIQPARKKITSLAR